MSPARKALSASRRQRSASENQVPSSFWTCSSNDTPSHGARYQSSTTVSRLVIVSWLPIVTFVAERPAMFHRVASVSVRVAATARPPAISASHTGTRATLRPIGSAGIHRRAVRGCFRGRRTFGGRGFEEGMGNLGDVPRMLHRIRVFRGVDG